MVRTSRMGCRSSCWDRRQPRPTDAPARKPKRRRGGASSHTDPGSTTSRRTRCHAAHVMRIAHVVVTNNFAGVERYVSSVAIELALRGHEVAVVGGDQDVVQER